MSASVKRFYDAVSVDETSAGFGVFLDGRAIKTPGRAPLSVPRQGLAELIAEEWRGQKDKVDFAAMPFTRTLYQAIDHASARPEKIAAICAYSGSDLLCIRTDNPADLAALQNDCWQPLLDWAEKTHGIWFAPTYELIAQPQPVTSVANLRSVLETRSDLELALLQRLTAVLGSSILALAAFENHIDADEAHALSTLEERYQEKRWGSDAEAIARRAGLHAETDILHRTLQALK